MHNLVENLNEIDARLKSIATAGYSLALNIREFTPEYYRTTYPEAWVKIYHERRFALFDPVTIWWRFNEGCTRWSEIELTTAQAAGELVMQQAASFGLVYGGCASVRNAADRSLKSLVVGGRSDRELTDNELDELAIIATEIMQSIGPHAGLSEWELSALRDLAEGLTHNEIADLRRVSPATVKKRIERARLRLGARNAVQAVAIATKRGLILNELPGSSET